VYVHNAGHSHPWEKPGFFLQSWLDFVQALDRRPSPDRRYGLRNRVQLPLELQRRDGRTWMVNTVDVSTTGVLLNSPEDCPPGTSNRLVSRGGLQPWVVSGPIIRHYHAQDGFLLAIHFDGGPGNQQFLGYVQEIINTQKPSISTSET
jgi:hypothetical protein